MMNTEPVRSMLATLYGEEQAASLLQQVRMLIEHYRRLILAHQRTPLSEQDSVLITYPDQVLSLEESPLRTLHRYCLQWVHPYITGVHILPYYPSSSDDGFSVVDFRQVDSTFGTWTDIQSMAKDFRLMSDCVLNHASSFSYWFRGFLNDEDPYRHYFISVDRVVDLTSVVRPRTHPLLTPYLTAHGPQKVWTTFSDDQIDLDYSNPAVLLEMLDVILLYLSQGVQIIRLDAIGYLWKEFGTSCINLPQVHTIVQIFRAVIEEVSLAALLITETNVAHSENISYFGDGRNEAHLVYNFALPPLVMHTLRTGDSTRLSEWAVNLERVPPSVTFFNFLASHDGIGINPVNGILSDEEISRLIDQTVKHGGLLSNKRLPDGSEKVYELNINYFDALSDPNSDEPVEIQVDRFLAAQAIMLTLRGLPGIYFHSLFGSRSWQDGVRQTGRNRTINRQKFTEDDLIAELTDPDSLRSRVFLRFRDLLRARSSLPAFHPFGRQVILNTGNGIFAVLRIPPGEGSPVLCLQNVTRGEQSYEGHVLKPYETLWLELESLMM